MKKVLVLGANGMAGHVVKIYLENLDLYEVWGVARGENTSKNTVSIDVSDTEVLKKFIKSNNFEVVINCIGLLNKTAENNPELAIWYNSYFPHLLASWGGVYSFKVIHISTDCVFSGKEGNYKENSFKNGIGFYAQSKALGEVINTKDLTFRTSIIGPELKKDGIGLFHWFMQQKGTISGFTEAYWTGVTTIELAKAIHEAINQELTGLYHLVNNTKISKFNLISEFNSIFNANEINIEINSTYKVDKSLINTRQDFDYRVPTYISMVEEMKNWIETFAENYKHYQK